MIFGMCAWWQDVIREGSFEGKHTKKVQAALRYGVLLFITSELLLFLTVFWAFYHSSLAPGIRAAYMWPPVGIAVFSPWRIPLVNTLVLLTSGATVTATHHAIVLGREKRQATMQLTLSAVSGKGLEPLFSTSKVDTLASWANRDFRDFICDSLFHFISFS